MNEANASKNAHGHASAVGLGQNDSRSEVVLPSSALIPIEGLSSKVQPQMSGTEEVSALRPKPQPSRWRQRLNHPLFASPDPTNLPISEQTRELRGSVKQLFTNNSGSVATAPRSLGDPESRATRSAPSTAVGSKRDGIESPDQSDYAHSIKLFRCPVITCKKTFEFARDFQHHKAVRIPCHGENRLWFSDRVTRMTTKGNG